MNKKTILRFACLLLAILSGFNLLCSIAAWLIADVFGGISFNITKASTIGIIGGADGPTAVFVTATPVQGWETLLWLVFFVVGIFGLRRFRNSK